MQMLRKDAAYSCHVVSKGHRTYSPSPALQNKLYTTQQRCLVEGEGFYHYTQATTDVSGVSGLIPGSLFLISID